MKKRVIVLDSWAVMAHQTGEPAAAKVADIIADAQEEGIPLLMSVVNAGEVWYAVTRRTSTTEADRTIRLLQEIGIRFIDVDWPLTRVAAGFKVKGKISYADCYAAAVTKLHKGSLVTGDPEFMQLENEISIVWLSSGFQN